MEKYTIHNPNIHVFDIGPAPLDKIVIIEYQENDVFLSVYSDPEGDLYIVSHRSIIESGADISQMDDYLVECYEGIQAAGESDYRRNFLELSKMLYSKWLEIKEHELDTKYFGIRIGATYDSDGLMFIAEAFNDNQPEHKEYIQIRKKNDEYIYTVSHESYFMKYQLGEMYPLYFGDPPSEDYIVNINDLSELDRKYFYFAQSFRNLQKILSEKETIETDNEIDLRDKPIITSIKGKNKDGYQIIEMVLDINKISRLYLSIQKDKKNTFYRVTKSSALESVLLCENISDVIEERVVIDSGNELLTEYFIRLNKAFEYMLNNSQNYLWRYGDGHKYDN